jgi:hypothetical protein
MIACMENAIVLTEAERMELNQRASSRSGRADDARRARLILLLEAAHTWARIRDKLDSNDTFRRTPSPRRSKRAFWNGRSSAKPRMARRSGALANPELSLALAT